MSEREEPEPSRGIQRQRAASAALSEEEPSSTPMEPIAPHPARHRPSADHRRVGRPPVSRGRGAAGR